MNKRCILFNVTFYCRHQDTMYKGFFGLKDTPFSIAPNPQYLYMSDRHKEALAHLMFGLRETGGFVLLTGEVGTGKTTTSRCLLEQVPDDTKVAFILNPTLTEHELLATICDEFSIESSSDASIKELTDSIRDFLLANHKADQNALLIIDEAQHLKPEVLEQLRLLTNLETNTKKLLQVILIGQPELQQLLKRQELRQLAQRITARYHLLPLTLNEVAAYVVHRLTVAGCQQAIFTRSAIKEIHVLSGGIPRIINLLCDRALLGAYGQNKSKVDAKIIKQAAVEALGHDVVTHSVSPNVIKIVSGIILLIFVFMSGWWLSQPEESEKSVKPIGTSSMPLANNTPTRVNTNEQIESNRLLVKQQDINSARDSNDAFNALFALWKIEIAGPLVKPCQQISDWRLGCYSVNTSISRITKLNYPSVVKLYDTTGQAFYGVLFQVNQATKHYQIQLNNIRVNVSRDWLDEHWRGEAIVIWQQPTDFKGEIKPTSEQAQIQWLENALSYIQQRRPRVITEFDSLLQRNLNNFQNTQSLTLTPYADEETLIAIQRVTHTDGPSLKRIGND